MKELNVILHNACKYKDKKDNSDKTRVAYNLADEPYKKTDNFKGASDFAIFSDGSLMFDSLDAKDFGVKCVLLYEDIQNPRNPISTYPKVCQLKVNGKILDVIS